MINRKEEISSDDAYRAMIIFLRDIYLRTKSDDLGSLLGSMCLLSDGKPADQAIFHEWQTAVRQATQGTVDIQLRLQNTKPR